MPDALRIVDPRELLGTRATDTTLADRFGVTKVVYSLVYPETRAVLEAIWHKRPHALFDRAYLDVQDGAEDVFLDAWMHWARPLLGDLSSFAWRYATGGSTEAIRESIWMHARRAQSEGDEARIHVFEGEYEGYAAYAAAAGVRVIAHPRERWSESIASNRLDGDRWYISQPSAIDGDDWPDFDAWLSTLASSAPRCEVMLDATYVGATAKDVRMTAAVPAIHTLFFSLSKIFGVYYHRIGGCLSRQDMPGLYGNRWFKNMLSLHLGHALLQAIGPGHLARRWAATQAEACRQVSLRIGLADCVYPSDAVMLAHIDAVLAPALPAELQPLRRGTGYRLCLTPMMTELLATPDDPKP